MRVATLEAVRLPSHSVKIMAGMLREHGHSPEPALRSANLGPAILDDPASDVTGLQELHFQQAFRNLTADDPEIWLRLGTRYGLLSHARDFYGLAMATAATVQDALEVAAGIGQYHCTLAQGAGLFEGGRRIGVRSDDSEVPADHKLFTIFRDIGINCRVYSELWGGDFPYERIELPIPRRYEGLVKPHLPGAALRFGANHNLWYYSTFVDERRPPLTDPVLHQYYRRKCEASLTSGSEDIAAQLLDCMEGGGGHLSIGEAAAQLGMSTRSLQRRLGERGETFRDIAQNARYNLACRKLRESGRPIAQIAFEAGYADLSSFYRAFRARSGFTPSAYRRKSRS